MYRIKKYKGKPCFPKQTEWFYLANGDKSYPLTFVAQINLEDVAKYDKEHVLPQKGMLLKKFHGKLESFKNKKQKGIYFMSGILNLNGNIYDVQECTETRLYIMESDETEGTITIAIDISFEKGEYEGENVRPSICINWHETGVSNFCELVGRTFAVDNVDESNEREDTFYLFEHEPMESYQFTILEIKDNEVHIAISGIAITDGYSNPYKVADFTIDCWLAIPK